ncbi:TPA: hypothetical protein ACPYY0_005265, partial [Escherichia coli]|uniref:hypothetical protein n=8 Tax=Pseudomonadota TaxID=1224 RepID=UPI00196A3BC6
VISHYRLSEKVLGSGCYCSTNHNTEAPTVISWGFFLSVCGGCVLSVVVELCTIPHKSLTVRSSTPSHKTFFFTHSQLIGCFINNPKGDI